MMSRCDDVTDLIKATPEDDIWRRYIYYRPPDLLLDQGACGTAG